MQAHPSRQSGGSTRNFRRSIMYSVESQRTISRISRTSSMPLNYLGEYSIFIKPAQSRDAEENAQIIKILKRFAYFENSHKDILSNQSSIKNNKYRTFENFLSDCAVHLQLEHFTKGETIFHKGDYGKKVYFICKGSVGVYINRDKESRQDEETKMENLKFKLQKAKQDGEEVMATPTQQEILDNIEDFPEYLNDLL